MRFVVSVAKQYQDLGLELMDLISEGNLGLERATKSFDPSYWFWFLSYAVWHIRWNILKHLQKHGQLISKGIHFWDKSNKLSRILTTFETKEGRQPTDEELCTIMGIDSYELSELRKAEISKFPIRYDLPLFDDNEYALSDTFPSTIKSPSEMTEEHDMKTTVDQLLKILSPEEAEMITLSFWLQGKEKYSYTSLALKKQISEQQLIKILWKAIKRLKIYLWKNKELSSELLQLLKN